MLVLDTDHLIDLGYRSAAGRRLEGRLSKSDLPTVIPIISVPGLKFENWLE